MLTQHLGLALANGKIVASLAGTDGFSTQHATHLSKLLQMSVGLHIQHMAPEVLWQACTTGVLSELCVLLYLSATVTARVQELSSSPSVLRALQQDRYDT